jgi:hypothetical protein
MDVLTTKVAQFKASIMTLLAETGGARLIPFCDSELNSVGETYTFNRLDESNTQNSLDMFDAGFTGNGGDTSKVVVTTDFIYSADWITEKSLKQTNVDLKSAYAKSFKRAIDRAIDDVIVKAITDNDANLTKAGDVSKTLKENFDVLVQKVAYTMALVDDNDDHGNNVALIMNRVDFAELFTIDKFINADYNKGLGISSKTNLAGAIIIPTDSVPKGTQYIMPRMTVCFTQWKGGNKANMDWESGKDEYKAWARTSAGAKLGNLDATSITKISNLV